MAIEKVEEKKKPTQPWRPANIIDVAEKHRKKMEGTFRLRWVRPDQVDKKVAEGWEFVKAENPEDVSPERTIIDGKPLDGTVRKRRLILMRLPEDVAVERSKYFQKLTDGSVKKQIRELKEASTIDGSSRIYGDIKEEGGKR